RRGLVRRGVAIINHEIGKPVWWNRSHLRGDLHHAPDRLPAVFPFSVRHGCSCRAFLRAPPEEPGVELGCLLSISRPQLIPSKSAGLSDKLRSDVRLRLPYTKGRALRVLNDRHSSNIHDVERAREHRASKRSRFARGIVGALD